MGLKNTGSLKIEADRSWIAHESRADRTVYIASFGGRNATLVSENTAAKDVDTLLLCVGSFSYCWELAFSVPLTCLPCLCQKLLVTAASWPPKSA